MKPKKYSSEKISLWLDDRIQKAYVRVYDGGFEQMDDYIFAFREEQIPLLCNLNGNFFCEILFLEKIRQKELSLAKSNFLKSK